MEVLRTPDECFEELEGYGFEPRYVELADGLRVHHLDEGPADGPPVLLLHGEPTWAYLYRTVVPTLVDAGLRCIVPDLVGFGRSDKPAEVAAHSYQAHVDWMSELVFDDLDLHGATFFGQDWGGLIGLRLVAAAPERFARVVVANTFLPTGDGTPSDAFLSWQRFSQEVETFPTGTIVRGGCAQGLSDGAVASYDAPFPEERFKAGPRAMPPLVPTSPDDPASAPNRAAWEVLSAYERPFLCAFSDRDPITKGNDRGFLSRVPGTKGQPHTIIEGGGHFLQEDRGEQVGRVIADFVAATS